MEGLGGDLGFSFDFFLSLSLESAWLIEPPVLLLLFPRGEHVLHVCCPQFPFWQDDAKSIQSTSPSAAVAGFGAGVVGFGVGVAGGTTGDGGGTPRTLNAASTSTIVHPSFRHRRKKRWILSYSSTVTQPPSRCLSRSLL